MLKDFRDLEVWQKAKDIIVCIYKITDGFPRKEIFGLTDQLRRASNSVCANIAEGFSRFHSKDKIKFYYNARGSVSECMSHVVIAKELGYISEACSNELLPRLESVKMMISRMIGSVARCDHLRRQKP